MCMKLKGTGVLIKYMVIHDLSSFFLKVGISIFTLLSLILLRLAACEYFEVCKKDLMKCLIKYHSGTC